MEVFLFLNQRPVAIQKHGPIFHGGSVGGAARGAKKKPSAGPGDFKPAGDSNYGYQTISGLFVMPLLAGKFQ